MCPKRLRGRVLAVPKNPETPIGSAVRRLREQKQWTQEQLAEKAELTPTGVWMIENGRTHPRRKTIDALAKALGVDLSDLFVAAPDDAPAENPPGLIEMLEKGLADPPPNEEELAELRGIQWRGTPDGVSFLYALQAIRRANRPQHQEG